MADTYINGVRVPFLPARGVDGLKQRTQTGGTGESSFENVLQEELRASHSPVIARERLGSTEHAAE